MDSTPAPLDFKSQFLAAVPPGNGDASPFSHFFFNLTGMGEDTTLQQAIRRGSAGMPPMGRSGVTDWELYNVMATVPDRTTCNRWGHRTFGPIEVMGYLEVHCPTHPADLPLPGPDGAAAR